MYQDLSTCQVEGNLKCIFGSSLRPLRALNKDISAASKMLLNGVRLCYRQSPYRLLKMQEICLQFLFQPSLSAPSPTLQFYYTTTINNLPHPIILAAAACCTNTGSGAWSCGASGSIREKQKYSMWCQNLKGAQCSEPVKSRMPSIWFIWKKTKTFQLPGRKLVWFL